MDEKLKKTVLEMVDRCSGGIKALELASDLAQRGYSFDDVDKFYEVIESIPSEIPELGLLEYHADLGGGFLRTKHFIYRKEPAKNKIVRKGFAQAMDGKELWINTETDERVVMSVKDDKLRSDLYCRPVTVTFEFAEKA